MEQQSILSGRFLTGKRLKRREFPPLFSEIAGIGLVFKRRSWVFNAWIFVRAHTGRWQMREEVRWERERGWQEEEMTGKEWETEPEGRWARRACSETLMKQPLLKTKGKIQPIVGISYQCQTAKWIATYLQITPSLIKSSKFATLLNGKSHTLNSNNTLSQNHTKSLMPCYSSYRIR